MHVTRILLVVSLLFLCSVSGVVIGQGEFIYPSVILPQISEPSDKQIDPLSREKRYASTARFINDDYFIGPQDLINIDVFQVEELSRSVRVSSGGNISVLFTLKG